MAKGKSNKVLDFSEYSMQVKKGKANYISKKSGKTNNKIGVFFLLLVIIALVCICLFTPVFNIENIEVKGVNVAYLSDGLDTIENVETLTTNIANCTYMKLDGSSYYTIDEVIQFSGITKGNNIFKENLKKASQKIMEASYIKNATLTRRFPNTVVIDVEERTIVAFVDYVGSYICIDDAGYVMNTINKKDKVTEQPIVYGITPRDLVTGYAIGETLDADDPIKLQRVINVLNLFKKNELTSKIEQIDVTNKDEVLVTINEGKIKIDFGDMGNMNLKIQFLPTILEDVKDKKGTIYMNSNESDFKPRFFEDV